MQVLKFAVLGCLFLPALAHAEDKHKCKVSVTLQEGAIIKTTRCIAVQGGKNAPVKVIHLPDQYRLVDGAK